MTVLPYVAASFASVVLLVTDNDPCAPLKVRDLVMIIIFFMVAMIAHLAQVS